jgi:hypothetical protein
MVRSFACGVQVALMGVVGSAVAAMDANPGVAGVAGCGLDFLRILAEAEENKVMWAMCEHVCEGVEPRGPYCYSLLWTVSRASTNERYPKP